MWGVRGVRGVVCGGGLLGVFMDAVSYVIYRARDDGQVQRDSGQRTAPIAGVHTYRKYPSDAL